ncbi:MAG: BON domain-containing protein [Planctomycetales bacterium]
MFDTVLPQPLPKDISDSPASHASDRLPPCDPRNDPQEERARTSIAVERALRATGYSALRDVEVTLCRGVVTLWGQVPNYFQKQLAQAAAQRVWGVHAINNEIEVMRAR